MNLAMLSCAHVHTRGYFRDVAKRDNARIVTIWDDVPQRGRKFADELDAAFEPDISVAVGRDDVDGFLVCAENARHLPILRAAIPAGKPIFCEKPLSADPQDAGEIVALARTHETPVLSGYHMPFSAEMQGVIRAVADGRLGHVTHARCRNAHHGAYGRWFDDPTVAWFTDPALAGGGAFLDMGSHAVHMMRTLLGPAGRVWAKVANLSGQYPLADDWGLALIEFDSGVLCQIEASWVHTVNGGDFEVVGADGTIRHDAELKGFVIAAAGKDSLPIAPGVARPHQVGRLLAAIEGTLDRDEIDADLVSSADAVAIMHACYLSSQTGQWVDVQGF